MNTTFKKQGKTALFGALFSLATVGNSQAGLVKIFNDNMDEVAVTIVAEADPRIEYTKPTCWKCLAGLKTPNKPHQTNVVLTSADLCGKKFFNVDGTIGGLLFHGECRHLSVLKNYEIHFLNSAVGTACFSREI